MNFKERTILHEIAGETRPLVCVESRTRVDTGSWLIKRRVWICVFEDSLVLIAASRRRFVERYKLSDIADSHYSPMTGEFIIYPAEGIEHNAFRVSAREALEILQVFKNQSQPTNQAVPSVA